MSSPSRRVALPVAVLTSRRATGGGRAMAGRARSGRWRGRWPRGVLLLALFGAPSGATAQSVVRGQVVDEGDLGPIVGAVVSLLDAEGDRIRSVFVDDAGSFVLPLPGDGPFTLRAEMIGRRSVDYLLAPGASAAPLTLRLPADPIELEGIDVRVGRECSMSPETAETTYLVWREVQKALVAASLTASEAIYQFRVALYRRERRRSNDEILEESVEQQLITGYDPFGSLSPEHVHEFGYLLVEGDDYWVYGPSTEVLLSRAFESDHCFGLERDGERGLIGLTFEPARGRRVPEVTGVLWLDEASGELRALEFEFLRMPRILGRGRYSGSATFRRLDRGSWTIDGWRLRSPPSRNRFSEEAGEILEVVRIR